MEGKPELRVGTGYGNNTEVKKFIEDLVAREIVVEEGGIMDVGAFLFINGKKHNVAHMSLDEVKELLTKNSISF